VEPSDAQATAATAAHGFQVFQCQECAAHIRNTLLATGHHGQMIEIQGLGGRDFMVCLSYDAGRSTISQNGKHVAIRIGDMVFDNLHPDGLPFDIWLRDFDAIGGVAVHATIDF
jgi:hypothetical protein